MTIDPLLHAFVAVFDDGDRAGPSEKAELSLTVSCGGLVVSGRLISQRTYMLELAENLRNSAGSEGARAAGRKIAHALERLEMERMDALESEPKFMHMRARFYVGGGGASLPTSGEILWRCRVDEVDGFSIGELAAG